MNMFIAGVGNVELFKGNSSVLVSKTLVDSSINLSVSLEDIRAGQGAKLYGKYAHSSGMTMKLTDAMFRLEFLRANIGATTVTGGSAVASVSKTVGTGNTIDIAGINPQKLYPEAQETIVWVAKEGSTDFVPFVVADGAASVVVTNYFVENDKVCVRYIQSNDSGETLTVDANFIPDTLTAVLTAPLFAGDNNNLETSTKVGTLTITIPRFMLNGTTDLSMTMTGATQMALEGSALAVEGAGCDNDGYYAIISQVITNQKITDNLIKVATQEIDDREDLATALVVMGYYSGVGMKILPKNSYELDGEQTGVTYDSTTGILSVTETGVVTVKFKLVDDAEGKFNFDVEVPAAE